MPVPSRSRFAQTCTAALAACVALAPAVPCRADACKLELTGAESAPWGEAARALVALALDERDCARIRLEVTDSGARLTFVTRDARSAERALLDPDELLPTIEALRVTLPEPAQDRAPQDRAPAATPTRSRSLPTPGPVARANAEPLASETEPVQDDSGPSPILAVLSGTRGGGDSLFSPVLGGVASLLLARWELGVTAAFEPQYFDLRDGASSEQKASALAFGVTGGRREPLGRFAVLYGARLSGVILLHDQQNRGRGEARAGAYLGLALPRRADVRFRAELGADLVGADQSFSEETPVGESSGPIAPEWAISALLGIEIGGP